MEARLRSLFVQQVDRALAEDPSQEALLRLLQIADPGLTESEFLMDTKRKSTLRKLNLLIHPDKDTNDKQATERFQSTQSFYAKCTLCLGKDAPRRKKHSCSSPRSVGLSLEFHVKDKWPFLDPGTLQPAVSDIKTPPGKIIVEKAIGYKCINFRGAIAHGRKTERAFTCSAVIADNSTSAAELFDKRGGHTKLESVEDIKLEISTRGPVVSTSFTLTREFLKASGHADYFNTSLAGDRHSVLIVGWELSSLGEVWLVRSLRGTVDIPIAIYQFSIEDEVLAPANDFLQTPWQDESKAFDICFSGVDGDWYSWSNIDVHVSSDKLKALFKILDCSWSKAVAERKKRFLFRDESKKARSRWAYLKDIEWSEEHNEWKISARFCE